MMVKCSNCGMPVIDGEKFPKIVGILEEYYGDYWSEELNDISMEICDECGTLDGLLHFVEKNLARATFKSHKNVIQEFADNQHIPYILSIGAPILIYLLKDKSIGIKKSVVDTLGNYGALDDVGRFVLSNIDPEIQILGLRALEKIEKHSKKRGLPFNWKEFLDIIINDDLDQVQKIKKKLREKRFLKPETSKIIGTILEKR